ncbi:ATP-grasp domain-containing protein [Campylobacter porcelli]|uniref:phosphoglycolate phosphatase n=1 Tax=Campylobacter porcelli TaxID=1660073 RepID=A0A1X9SXX3_9BACT|nr:ATP-grasp domain-containing protein [Campylobacter sp. RM6137]ARR01152.1 carbamoyl phosphate synthase-like protein [Campylobacter sp. RM6137]
MIRILFLSAGTNAAYHCIKILKEKFSNNFYIVGVDINEKYLVASCNYLDNFYKVPRSDSMGYYDIILEILAQENIDFLFTILDVDQGFFSSDNKDLENIGVRTFSVDSKLWRSYKSKDTMNNLLNLHGFLTPKLYNLNEIELNRKYFIKSKKGFGSIGARIATGKDIHNINNVDDYLIQEICIGPEYTVECFKYHNTIRTVTRERIETKAGVCTKTKVFNNLELEHIAREFAKKIDCPHCFNLQFMKNSIDQFVITDVNFRFAGGMSLAYAAGWDEVSALAEIMLNKSENEILATVPDKIQPQYIVRAYNDVVTKIDRSIVAFDFDGTLLDSRKRHIVVLDDILKQFDINLDTTDLIDFKRNNKNNVDYLISKGINENLAKEIQAKWIENIEKEEYLALDTLYSATIKVLEEYSKENDLILVTARNNKVGLQNQIDRFDLRKYFKEIYVVNSNKDISTNKAQILKNENVAKFFGDTLSDKKAADLAGIEFIYCENGFYKLIQ